MKRVNAWTMVAVLSLAPVILLLAACGAVTSDSAEPSVPADDRGAAGEERAAEDRAAEQDREASLPTPRSESERAAFEVLDEFMRAFNARDEVQWTNTMHFPHVRIASGQVQVDTDAETMMEAFDFVEFAERFDWDHSAWLSREIVQSSPEKVHVVVRFGRFRADGTATAAFDSLYVVALRDGKWGIVARSSFAP